VAVLHAGDDTLKIERVNLRTLGVAEGSKILSGFFGIGLALRMVNQLLVPMLL